MKSSGDTDQFLAGDLEGHQPDLCNACQAALQSVGRDTVSFLLLDQLTIPLVGCDEHLEQFRSVCELTTENTVELLDHVPAGGLPCPGCRLARHNPEQAIIPVDNGIVPVLACPTHQSDIAQRYWTGLETRQQLTSSIELP